MITVMLPVQEALRLYSPAYMVGRCACADVQLGQYSLEKGTTILVRWVATKRRRLGSLGPSSGGDLGDSSFLCDREGSRGHAVSGSAANGHNCIFHSPESSYSPCYPSQPLHHAMQQIRLN